MPPGAVDNRCRPVAFPPASTTERFLALRSASVPLSAAALRELQQALVDLGYLARIPSLVDGAMGPATQHALKNFQISARRFDCTIAATGQLDAATLAALQRLTPAMGAAVPSSMLPQPMFEGTHVRVVVCLREHRTFLFDANGRLSAVFPNASGAQATPTSTGLRTVTGHIQGAQLRHMAQTRWHDPNVFGAQLVDLSFPNGRRSGEELHGASSIRCLGQAVSHGCMRHDPEAIRTLFSALSVGDNVAIVDSIDDPRLGAPAPRPVPPRAPIAVVANAGPMPPRPR